MLRVEEVAKIMHLTVERFKSRVGNEELSKALLLRVAQLGSVSAQDAKRTDFAFNLGGDLAAKRHEVRDRFGIVRTH